MNDTITTSPTNLALLAELRLALDALVAGDFPGASAKLRTIDAGPDPLAPIRDGLASLANDLGEIVPMNERYMFQIERQAQELAEKLELIQRQQHAIRELSTPIIEIWDAVLVLPMIGVIDTRRAADATERLLYAIVERRARAVIVDVTGIDVVDTATADHFLKMMKATRLLGATCVVSGIGPEIAQTLARTGVDFGDLPTLRTLKDALRHCIVTLRHANAMTRDALGDLE
jgi:rsbT co-antagonist protein RsbR